MSKAIVKPTFEASRTLRPIYTGGSTALDATGRILLTCVGEDALIVNLDTGDQLASLEGVRASLPRILYALLIAMNECRMERSSPV
jgi:hypothetical protein